MDGSLDPQDILSELSSLIELRIASYGALPAERALARWTAQAVNDKIFMKINLRIDNSDMFYLKCLLSNY